MDTSDDYLIDQTRVCTNEEKLNIEPDNFIHFVIDSVFAIAHAIKSIIRKNCKDYNDQNLFECKYLNPITGPSLLKEIQNVEFVSITNRTVRFSQNGDGFAPYEVFQYQKKANGKYVYETIAEWDGEQQ
jgi:hypothetical protein